ncbi:MAG: VWA domain-containing protein [Acidibacillus sp.]|nr:VWA domain-containing protein [Acidibacillus sp.]
MVSWRKYRSFIDLSTHIAQWKKKRAWKRSINPQIDRAMAARRQSTTSNHLNEPNHQFNEVKTAPDYLAKETAMRQESGIFYKSNEADENWGGEYVSDLDSAPATNSGQDRVLTGSSYDHAPSAREEPDEVVQSLEEAQMLQIESWVEKFQEKSSTVDHVMNEALDDADDMTIENVRQLLLRQSFAWKRDEVMHMQQVVQKSRHKYIDPKRTIRHYMSSGSGVINRFAYRKSPSVMTKRGLPVRFLIIGDVSGSMGRYVGVALYLLSSLRALAVVDSYIFSDAVTHTGPLLIEGSFREQFTHLKNNALSWEYGTLLGTALEEIIGEATLTDETIVVLFTDGGFSLENGEWERTVHGMIELSKRTQKIFIATPNPHLYEDGAICAQKLGDVRAHTHDMVDMSDPMAQKIARFGLLGRYSDEIVRCETPGDAVLLFKQLIHVALCV